MRFFTRIPLLIAFFLLPLVVSAQAWTPVPTQVQSWKQVPVQVQMQQQRPDWTIESSQGQVWTQSSSQGQPWLQAPAYGQLWTQTVPLRGRQLLRQSSTQAMPRFQSWGQPSTQMQSQLNWDHPTESFYQTRNAGFAVKTNVLYGGYTFTPNLGAEIGLGLRSTLDIGGGYNPWNLDGESNNNTKLVHWLGSAEYRYWFCERFNGHYLGGHLIGGQYNIAGHELPLLFEKNSEKYRFEGWVAGAGISYGYQFILGPHFNIEANIGFGYARLEYDKFNCAKCSEMIGSESKDYFGPTKNGISLIYIF